jgi:alginate O-acetyltransferase complex protein AlgI
LVYSLPVILYHIYYLVRANEVLRPAIRLEYAVYGVLLFLILVNSGRAESFIYFQF